MDLKWCMGMHNAVIYLQCKDIKLKPAKRMVQTMDRITKLLSP